MHEMIVSAAARALFEGRESISSEDLTGCAFEAPSLCRQSMDRELRV